MSKEHTGSFLIAEAKIDNKIKSTTTINGNSSLTNIELDGTNYRTWSKIFEMHIIGREKRLHYWKKKLPQKLIISFMINGKLKMP